MSGRVGIDTGGTFTDFVRLDGRRLIAHKVQSTPSDPSRAILGGLRELAEDFARLASGAGRRGPRMRAYRASWGKAPGFDVVHGSTVATNAVLERTGARVALVATAGFEDVLRIGRQTRPELYNVFVPVPRPLVDPELTFGVTERLDVSGRVLVPLQDAEGDALAERLLGLRVDIVAVCLLHSYVNPAHELGLAELLRRRGLAVCTSHDVLPEYREFERWSTTVVNAYVTPLIDRYLGRLELLLQGSEVPRFRGSNAQSPEPRNRGTTRVSRLSVMQSNGGSISAPAARRQAVRTILSGPAAGVVGARAVARAAGFRRVISFDMGGTSTDVSLIDDQIATTTDARVGDFPVRLPIIDIETVGAGGGSIAYRDSGGALRVGPRSAGADPGPVCCGSGRELTVTDANLLLGRLAPELFFGGRLPIDADRARRVAETMAADLGLTVHDLAEGIIRVANANMERAIRLVSLERGHDPRGFALLAFGGAGGMHACEIAQRLDIRCVVIPRHAGVLSALGMLMADVTKDYSAPVLRESDALAASDLAGRFSALVRQARGDLRAEGFGPGRQHLVRSIDLRYLGQSYELTVPYTRDFRESFDRAHERRYGYSDRSRPTEVVNVRVVASGLTVRPNLPFRRPRRAFAPTPHAIRGGQFDGRSVHVAHHRWSELEPGARGAGPAVLTSGEATAVIPPGFTFRIDGFGNVVAEAHGPRHEA